VLETFEGDELRALRIDEHNAALIPDLMEHPGRLSREGLSEK
jgi:hypothetical protein